MKIGISNIYELIGDLRSQKSSIELSQNSKH